MDRKFALFISFLCISNRFQSTLEQAPPRSKYISILQDSRDEPTPDGTFGYLYKTEDGIVSSARGGPNGAIQGGFSYTDPTGLKVNINYNAGSRASPTAVEPSSRQRTPEAPRYYGNEANPPAPARAPVYRPRPQPQYYDDPAQDIQYEAVETNPRYISRPRPKQTPRSRYIYRPQYYQPQPRRSQYIDNDIYEEYPY
ncbi:unnamed protein product [Phyllotreta striolata]|uniref:Uncharacterized protein n=1 Tax=Phyllotreta striolata TaxID=444603 RepID=A0A9N9TV70_PHYSR|nr:unnamed protein product [Phyllotreta striolata]